MLKLQRLGATNKTLNNEKQRLYKEKEKAKIREKAWNIKTAERKCTARSAKAEAVEEDAETEDREWKVPRRRLKLFNMHVITDISEYLFL